MDPRQIEATLVAMERNIAAIRALRDETRAVLDALKALKENGEALFNIGAGVLVPAKKTRDKVFISIGAEVALEKDIDSAIELLQKRLESAEKALERAIKERDAFIAKVRQAQERAQNAGEG